VKIFNRGSEGERELANLRRRWELVAGQLQSAERALNEAVDERRKVLLEADLENLAKNGSQSPKAFISRLRDEHSACVDALATLDHKIVAAEQKIAVERDIAARQAEAELRTRQISEAEEARARFIAAGELLAQKLEPLVPTAIEVGAAAGNVKFLTAQLALGVEAGLVAAKGYAARITETGEPIRVEIAKVEPPKPLPRIERRSMLLLQASLWPDPEEPSPGIRTSGKMTTVPLPLAVADAAERYGFALEPYGPVAMRYREFEPVDYAYNSPNGCRDISKPPVKSPGDDQTVTSPVIHSSLAGARVGVANAAPVSR
jgi:hypothetical protein